MFGVADPRWIEAVVAAVVVPKPAASLDAGGRDRALPREAGRLQDPKHVVFVDSLPKNPSGKLLKRELRERYADLARRRTRRRRLAGRGASRAGVRGTRPARPTDSKIGTVCVTDDGHAAGPDGASRPGSRALEHWTGT